LIRLIVNADDLGSGSATDRGIFRAFYEGIVTSASLMATGPSCAEAAREAHAAGLPVGAHLNLSEGRPLSGEVRGLTTSAGTFPGKAETRRRLAAGLVDANDLRAELAAQVGRLLETGLRLDHLDTHQHIFLFPEVATAALAVGDRFGIAAARLPLPCEPKIPAPDALLEAELSLYRRLAPAAARLLADSHLATPDGLWGMAFLNRLDETSLAGILKALPAGTWELMTHPGGCDPSDPFAGPERETEVAALTSPAVRSLIAELGIELATFGGLACAS